MIIAVRKAIAIVVCIITGTVLSAAVNPEATFKAANEAFEQKDFSTSISLYEQLLREDYRSEAVLYNLGMACLEQKQLGKAVLYLERALLLKPGDKDARHNLNLIKTQYLQDQLDVIPESFLVRWWKNAYQMMSSGAWSVFSLIFIWLAMAGLSIWRIGKARTTRKWGFFVGISFLLLSILMGNLAYSRYSYEFNNGRGVVMTFESSFRVAPDTDSEALMELHGGTSFKIVSELNSWFKVRLTDGRMGWIKKQDVSLI